jgi:hypothetical protein
MEESINLLGARVPPVQSGPGFKSHGQKEAPVLGPAAVAEGHQPTPTAGIAKPKAKGRKLPKAIV